MQTARAAYHDAIAELEIPSFLSGRFHKYDDEYFLAFRPLL
jgi:hypothetical protein